MFGTFANYLSSRCGTGFIHVSELGTS